MATLPGFESVPATVGTGSYDHSTDTAVLLLHRTEGSSVEGAIGAYRGHTYWPTFTVDSRTDVRRRVQHLDLGVPARALVHSGATETNRKGRIVAQVEWVGFSDQTPGTPVQELEWLGSEVFGPIFRAGRIPPTCDVVFAGNDAYGTGGSVRLSEGTWRGASGFYGHQHVPSGNVHWDPGHLSTDQVRTILSAAGGQFGLSRTDLITLTNVPQEDTMERLVRVEKKAGPAALVSHQPRGLCMTAVSAPNKLRYVPLVRPGGYPEVAVTPAQFAALKAQATAGSGFTDLQGVVHRQAEA